MIEHEHTYQKKIKRTLVHKYRKNKPVGSSTGTDTLYQWVCSDPKCKKTVTYSLERKS